ncbi:MAG TPA: helix-turn-helix domain-containing protein [Gemmatimonadaceae bacterium]|nr:helix-turn-helix domain-containing protein [Gemmatimonadaceae bacterium]
MQYRELPPPPPLDRWIRCFWFLTTSGGGPPQPVVPDGRLEIVLHRAEPFGQVMPDDSVRSQQAVMVSGQITRPVVLRPLGPADIIGIRFRTAGARDLLGLPLAELTDHVIALRDVAGSLASALEAAARSEDPVRVLSGVLVERVRTRAHASTSAAVERLAGGERVADLARRIGLTTRTLERRVRDDTGLSPKTLQRVMRFRLLYALLQSGAANGARAAAMAGYYDQAHANRDFRQFAGASPTEHFAADPELSRAILSHSS